MDTVNDRFWQGKSGRKLYFVRKDPANPELFSETNETRRAQFWVKSITFTRCQPFITFAGLKLVK